MKGKELQAVRIGLKRINGGVKRNTKVELHTLRLLVLLRRITELFQEV